MGAAASEANKSTGLSAAQSHMQLSNWGPGNGPGSALPLVRSWGQGEGGEETTRSAQLSGAFPGVETWEVSIACQTVGGEGGYCSAFLDALKSNFLPSF